MGMKICLTLAASVSLSALPVLAQPAPVDCQTELIACTNDGEVVAVSIIDGTARLLSTYLSVPDGERQPAAVFGTEIEYDFNTGKVWLESRANNEEIIEIDILTGGVLDLVTHGRYALAGMEFFDTTLYVAGISLVEETEQGSATFGTFDLGTGVATPIGQMGTAWVSGLALHPTTGVLYGITAGGSPATLVTVDVTTGLATSVGATGYVRIGSIEFGPDGNLYGGTTSTATPNAEALVLINPATGATTLVGTTGYSITGLAACDVVPVELMAFSIE